MVLLRASSIPFDVVVLVAITLHQHDHIVMLWSQPRFVSGDRCLLR